MAISLPALPYDKNALSPYISAETLEFHHGKHHATYVNKLNGLIEGTDLEDHSLEDIIMKSEGAVFNNAAQIWNHTFYWNCLSDVHHQTPSEKMKALLNNHFGSFEAFKDAFTQAACNQFGSGWAWLVQDDEGGLKVVTTSNADLPMKSGSGKALMTCDVWEHAYYIDERNSRPKYLENFWNVLNWKFVESHLS